MNPSFTNQFQVCEAQMQDLEPPQVPEEEPTELYVAQLDDQLAGNTELLADYQLPLTRRGRGRPRKVGQGEGSSSGRAMPRERRARDRLPEGLPPGWRVEEKTRKGGKSAGHVDKYYYNPEGRCFRSIPEVKRFLRTHNVEETPIHDGEERSEPESMDGIPAEVDMSRLCFRDEAWLEEFPLDRDMAVFEYFALSPFYDYDCTNQQLRESSIHPFDLSCLSQMTGFEYVLTEAKENLFVITKQKRDGPEAVTPVATYYVLDGSVYQAPSLRNVLEARIGRVMHRLSNAFRTTVSNLERIGYVGSENGPAANFSSTIGRERREESSEQASRVDNVLKSMWRSLPPAPPPPPFAEGYVPSEAEVEKEREFKNRRLS